MVGSQRLGAVVLVMWSILAPVQAAGTQSPSEVVRSFYSWYFGGHHGVDDLAPQRNTFTSDLYGALAAATKSRPPHDILDFDPFINAQDTAQSFAVGKTTVAGNTARVVISIIYTPKTQRPLTVVLRRDNGRWRIADIDYGKNFTLSGTLREINGK